MALRKQPPQPGIHEDTGLDRTFPLDLYQPYRPHLAVSQRACSIALSGYTPSAGIVRAADEDLNPSCVDGIQQVSPQFRPTDGSHPQPLVKDERWQQTPRQPFLSRDAHGPSHYLPVRRKYRGTARRSRCAGQLPLRHLQEFLRRGDVLGHRMGGRIGERFRGEECAFPAPGQAAFQDVLPELRGRVVWHQSPGHARGSQRPGRSNC
uniref:Uncharacterized protein n=1 Tax=Knufia peltigerae TaxID=1002370 RepID=A0AA38XXP0_9EURO|nr:hypothetical protein H2204_009727 [Knufia peltigerae]